MDADVNHAPEPPARGVLRAVTIAVFAACFVWIPYVVPGYEELQVVSAEDPLPLTELLRAAPRQGGAGIAGALRQPVLVEDDEQLMEAAPLPEALAVTPRPSRPNRPPSPDETEAQPALGRVDPAQYRGLTQEIEDPHGSMRSFYQQLGLVARDRPVLARMGIYGTSTNGADRTTSQLRRLLQAQFGDGGKGWVPVAAGWQYQRHQDVSWEFDHWRTYVVNRGDGPLDRYGYGGVVALPRHRGAVSEIGTSTDDPSGHRVRRFRLFYQAFPEGGAMSLAVDGHVVRRVETASPTVEDRVETIEVPDGEHSLTIRPVGEDDEYGQEDLRLYGTTLERDGPGVVVDGLALVGAFTRVLRLWDREHIQSQVRLRGPNLLVFWMGANDAVSESVAFQEEQYRRHYRGILRRFQDANPNMSCMVMSILDKGERVSGRIRTRPRVPRLVEVQHEVALAEGCAFFNTYEAIGGEDTMRRWYAASPRLVTDDLGHLTESGSRVMGTLLYRALMKGYDDWIADGQPGRGAD